MTNPGVNKPTFTFQKRARNQITKSPKRRFFSAAVPNGERVRRERAHRATRIEGSTRRVFGVKRHAVRVKGSARLQVRRAVVEHVPTWFPTAKRVGFIHSAFLWPRLGSLQIFAPPPARASALRRDRFPSPNSGQRGSLARYLTRRTVSYLTF